MTKSTIKKIAIVFVGILIILVGRWFFYYSGFYIGPPSEMPDYEQIVTSLEPSTEYAYEYEQGEGTVLLDLAHDNAFDVEELSVLTSRLISRGLTIELLGTENDLEEELSEANAFIIVCPQGQFTKEERETVEEFVNNGGKLLLIADPTRSGEINSISLKFSLIFESDYLYNLKENDANFRNIFITEFRENEITKGLEKIALYTAGSITSANCTAFADQNTFSSIIETRKELSPMALTNESKVLAIYDLTFITEPYNGILDNNKLISNIANWLASPAEEGEEEQEEEQEEETEEEQEEVDES